MRKWLALAAVVVMLVGGLGFALAGQRRPSTQASAPAVVTAPLPVSAEGIVVPVRQARLAFPQPGRVASVAVEAGQRVQAGALLATLDGADAALAVRAAEDSVRLARAELERVLQAARPEELASLRAAVGAAEAKLAQVRAGGGPDERAARAQLESASARLEQLLARPEDVQIAESQLAAALLKLEQIRSGARPEDVAVAEAQRRQAQARLEAAQAATSGGEIAAAQASLAAARSRLEQVRSGGRAEDVVATQAAADAARARLDQLVQGRPRAEDVRAAELEVDRARAALDAAVGARNAGNSTTPALPRAELDRLDAGVRSAQLGVELAQNALARVRAGADPWDVRQAQLAVEQAQTALDKLKTPGGFDVSQAEAAVAQAQAGVDRVAQASRTELQAAQAAVDLAQATLDKLRTPAPLDVEAAQEAARQAEAQLSKVRSVTAVDLAAARAAVAQAQAGLERVVGGRPLEVEAAQRAVEQAQAQLALRRAGATEAELEAARARVAQAETALAQAQARLRDLQLLAPFAATVTQVSFREGEQVTPATVGVTLGDLAQLRVETKDLDEVGAAKLELGQRVQVRVHALERTFPGRVTALSPQGVANSAGDAIFLATITLDQPDAALRWGQTAKIEFPRS